jgi:hypothetical protein
MAQLVGDFLFTGSLQNLTAYKMKGSDKIVIRKKGGPSKEQVKHSPRFDITRRNNREFGGRATAVQKIKRILSPLQFLADYNFTGPLNALLKPIQKMDTETEFGQRGILISKNPRLLEGFTLNRRYLFDSIVRNPVTFSLSKKEGKATVQIPALLPEINFVAPGNYQWYQFRVVFGIIPDLFYNGHRYWPQGNEINFSPEIAETNWLPVNSNAAAVSLSLNLQYQPETPSYSCMLAIGLAFGTLQAGHIQPVKYIGAAKILGME